MAEIPPGEAALPAASKITIDDESDDTESDTTPAEIKAKIERDVDELFKTKTVEEMEEIEKKLRGDLETMDAEIARTIGGSWKDFMENSKDIDLITSNLQEIVDGFAVVRDTLEELPEIIRKNNEAMEALRAPQEPEEFTPERATFAAGSRLKYLVDTPEKVWGALDEHEYAGAAMRYVVARDCVASCVETSEPPHLTRDEAFRKFPAFKQQTQALDSLRAQIARAARKALESPKAPRATIASALAAAVVVEGMSAEHALVLYLQTRRAWIRATLRRCGDAVGVDHVAGALARVLAEPARAIAAARACFLGGEPPVGDGDSPPLVYARLDEGRDETDVANVLFAGVVDPRREAEAWRRVVDSAKPARMSRARVAALCEEWLAGVASDALASASPPPESRSRTACNASSSSASDRTYSSSFSASFSSACSLSPPRAGSRHPSVPPSRRCASTSAAASSRTVAEKHFRLRQRFSTRRTPETCSGGHSSAAATHARTSGANRPAYSFAVSASAWCVTSALITYSTATLCLGLRA